jgi:hypothetical protein
LADESAGNQFMQDVRLGRKTRFYAQNEHLIASFAPLLTITRAFQKQADEIDGLIVELNKEAGLM